MFMFDFSFFLGQFFLFISAQKMYVRYVMKMWQVKVLTVITSLTIYPATYKFDWNIFNWIPIHILIKSVRWISLIGFEIAKLFISEQ